MGTSKKVVLVTGVTGAQGGSVARHLLSRGRFTVRGLTRKPDSDKARALRDAGVEIVRGDLDDGASLREALSGVYGAYGVTNFWEHFAHEREQGRNLVDAVAQSGVEHFVFSTLPNVKKETNGELDVPHFDIKAELEDYARQRALPATFVHLAFYFENFTAFFPPQPQGDGTFAFGFPQGDTPLAGVGVEDVGGIVARIFEQRDSYLGETVYIAGDYRPAAEYAAIMSRVLGRKIVYNHIPRDTFAGFGFPGAADIAHMFDYYQRYMPNRRPDAERSRAIYPELQTFEQWLERHVQEFEPVLNPKAAVPA